MIRINKQYLNRFSCNKYEYLYKVAPGIYLAFDKNTLNYIDVEMYYSKGNYIKAQKQADNLLNELISKDILEII